MNSQTNKQQSYVYFVAFGIPGGGGNTVVHRERPITTMRDVQDVTKQLIHNDRRLRDMAITNFQLMSAPDTCGTCGR